MATQPSSQHENKDHPTSLGRPWKVIAMELTEEHDSDKFLALCEELSRALDERQLARNQKT